MNVEIRKGNGIEGLVSRHTPEEKRIAEVVGEHKLKEIVEIYTQFLGLGAINSDRFVTSGRISFWNGYSHLNSFKVDVNLSPEMIHNFARITPAFMNEEIHISNTGLFISRLIQTRYEATKGTKQTDESFSLDLTYLGENIGTGLRGELTRPINLDVRGNIGGGFMYDAAHCKVNLNGKCEGGAARFAQSLDLTIYGDTSDCGEGAIDSQIIIYGDAEKIGNDSNNSTFEVHGDVHFYPGLNSKNSVFTLYGNITADWMVSQTCRTEQSIFRTTNNNALEKLIASIPRRIGYSPAKQSKNKIIFINPDNTEEVVRDYD